MTQPNAIAQSANTTISTSKSPTDKELAGAIRALSMDAVQAANSGHPGMPMGMADVATVLFSKHLKFDAAHPRWPNRDRFVLSAGHGSMLLYSLLYLTGYKDIDLEDIKNFRQLGSKTAGHPEYGHIEGIETTTGPLGQGLGNAVGMALAERMANARYGDAIVDHYTYSIAGDGCLMEGISQEVISLAGHLKLNKLIVLWDDNGITIDGSTDLSTSDDMSARFKAHQWNTLEVDGHDPAAVDAAISKAKTSDKPTLIACKTTIGYGSPNKAGTSGSHGSPLGAEEIELSRQQLTWPHAAFEIPEPILKSWRDIGARGAADYKKWIKAYDAAPAQLREKFEAALTGELGSAWQPALEALKKKMISEGKAEATRKSSQNVLEVLNQHIEQMVGGSADLTGSNNTKTSDMGPVTEQDYSGRYIYYGIREHGMAAVMNGLSLYGGFIPYGGTFLVFSDYCRPSIRLSALMNQRIIYVMTHDSIGLGEDGPTHQPIEHLASLRAIPNLYVFRPADAVETAECWALSISQKDAPSLLALSRQNLPNLAKEGRQGNPCAKGGYIIYPSSCSAPAGAGSKADQTDSARSLGDQQNDCVTLIATGSEVSLAIETAKELESKHIATRVVSMPCTELFDAQPAAYKNEVLGNGLRVSIEAASTYGWAKYTGLDGMNIGIDSFGASGPAEQVYEHFGLTPKIIAMKVKKRLTDGPIGA